MKHDSVPRPRILRRFMGFFRPLLSSMLFSAVERADAKAAAKLLSLGANPNARSESKAGFTPLTLNHTHSDERCAAIGRSLLQAGADPNLPNRDGLTPLHYAAQFALPLLCSELLEAGANPDLANAKGLNPIESLRAFHGETPSHYGLDHVAMIESLFERHALAIASASKPDAFESRPRRQRI